MAPIFKFSNFAPKFKFLNFAPKFKFLNFAPDKWRQFSNFAPKFIFKFRAKITIFELIKIYLVHDNFTFFARPNLKMARNSKIRRRCPTFEKQTKRSKHENDLVCSGSQENKKNNVVHGCHDLFSSLPRIVVCVSPRCAFVSFSFGWHVPHECWYT